MMYYAIINLQERVERYTTRGFQQPEAEILVLLEECASGLFSAFPDRFVLFGGATLVLFYDSPRLSRDLDLLATAEDLPPLVDITKTIENSIQALAETFGLGKLECQAIHADKDFIKIWVQSNQRRLFSVDLTRIGGTVLKSDRVRRTIAESDQKIVITPSADALLFQKCETFLDRRIVKSRDAFDIDVLLAKGAHLGNNLRARVHDFIEMRELDSESIRNRIDRVDTKLCTAELRPVLPHALFTTLAQQDFKPLRSSLETVFADWL
jgi:nucleotidyltransferase AbiEii toxin of type IV toxin-antitoxin system